MQSLSNGLYGLANGASYRLWRWVNVYFNLLDRERLKEIGADRVAAEWVVRCGGKVRFSNSTAYISDYDLVTSTGPEPKLTGIDASHSSISSLGCRLHFEGLTAVKELRLDSCRYLDDGALRRLSLLRESLEFLRIFKCPDFTDKGLIAVGQLKQLKLLHLYSLDGASALENVICRLKRELPQCQIELVDT